MEKLSADSGQDIEVVFSGEEARLSRIGGASASSVRTTRRALLELLDPRQGAAPFDDRDEFDGLYMSRALQAVRFQVAAREWRVRLSDRASASPSSLVFRPDEWNRLIEQHHAAGVAIRDGLAFRLSSLSRGPSSPERA